MVSCFTDWYSISLRFYPVQNRTVKIRILFPKVLPVFYLHDVTLFEATDKLGGELVIGGVPDFKEDDLALIKWYEHQLEELKIDVRLNTKATKANIDELKPDIVYIAEGSSPIGLKLPGIDSEKVVNASDVLSGKMQVGSNCVIIGGGLVGCELALHLKSSGHEVTIVEALPDILKSGAPMYDGGEVIIC